MSTFDTETDRYDQWFDHHPGTYESEVRAIRAALPINHGRGLEIGVGTGRFAGPLGITDGIEPAAAMRQVATTRGIHTVEGVAEDLPFTEGTFDVALMVTTICFVADPARSCREAWRVLGASGRFVIGLVDRDSFLGRGYQSRQRRNIFYRAAHFFSADEVATLMIAARFGNIQFRQTLFHHPDESPHTESIRSGHGLGGFVVVAGTKINEPS